MLRIEKLTKRFGKFRALSGVDLEVAPGEIHGLIGVNGSGKSTLLNVLFGHPVVRDTGGYSGRIFLDGRKVAFRTPGQAAADGVGMVHQEFVLFPEMTVAENIRIGGEKTFPFTRRLFGDGFSLIHRAANIREAEKTLAGLGLQIDPVLPIPALPVHMKQFVEIAREIGKTDLKLLLLDEPTAALNEEDVKKLAGILRKLVSGGAAVLYVSHRLEEIAAICNRVTVLRNGEVAGRFERGLFDADAIAWAMVGRRVKKASGVATVFSEKPAVEFDDFSVKMPGERIEGLNLTVFKGEILGVAGLSGHGRSALGPGAIGMFPTKGKVRVRGETVSRPTPSAMLSKGVCLLPEERRANGLLMDHSLMDNILFTAIQQKGGFLKKFPVKAMAFVDVRAGSIYAENCVKEFDISCRSVRQKVSELSGGNQQKACIARAMAANPEILFVSEPTRGVDIVAKEKILDIFLRANKEHGTTFVIASSELEELRRVCHRVAVFHKGRLFDILSPEREERDFARAFCGERL